MTDFKENPYQFIDERLSKDIGPETRAAITEFLIKKIAVKRSKETIKTYISDFNSVFTKIKKPISQITSTDLDEWAYEYGKTRLKNTVAQRFTHVNYLYNFLLNSDLNIIEKSPIKRRMLPKRHYRHIPRHLEPHEHIRVQIAAETQPLMERAIFLLLDSGALRRSEIPPINVSDIDFAAGKVSVIGKGNKKALVPVSTECLMVLKMLIQEHPKDVEALFISKKGIRIRPIFVYRLTIKLGLLAKTTSRLNPHRHKAYGWY